MCPKRRQWFPANNYGARNAAMKFPFATLFAVRKNHSLGNQSWLINAAGRILTIRGRPRRVVATIFARARKNQSPMIKGQKVVTKRTKMTSMKNPISLRTQTNDSCWYHSARDKCLMIPTARSPSVCQGSPPPLKPDN
jgi:hypothetical protein